MSIHVLNFAEIIIHRLALSLAAGAASPAFSWDNFPRMAVAHVKTQWVVAQGRSEEDLALHVFEVTAIARAVARDHAKAQRRAEGHMKPEWEPGAWEEARAFGRAVAEHIGKCCKDHKPSPFPPGVNSSDAEDNFSCPLCGMEFTRPVRGAQQEAAP